MIVVVHVASARSFPLSIRLVSLYASEFITSLAGRPFSSASCIVCVASVAARSCSKRSAAASAEASSSVSSLMGPDSSAARRSWNASLSREVTGVASRLLGAGRGTGVSAGMGTPILPGSSASVSRA